MSQNITAQSPVVINTVAAKDALRAALAALNFTNIGETINGCITTEDRAGVTPKHLRKDILEVSNCFVAPEVIQRNHGRIRYDDVFLFSHEAVAELMAPEGISDQDAIDAQALCDAMTPEERVLMNDINVPSSVWVPIFENAQARIDQAHEKLHSTLVALDERSREEPFGETIDKYINGEISKQYFYSNFINYEPWMAGHKSSAERNLIEALTKLGFQNISRTQYGYITTEDRVGVKPPQLRMLLWPLIECKTILSIGIKRQHGCIRYNVNMHNDLTIWKLLREERKEIEAPLTKDVELKLHERDTSEADLNMGEMYMYVFDAFMEVYGVYPEKLINREDYARLGRMMNLALIGERFDI